MLLRHDLSTLPDTRIRETASKSNFCERENAKPAFSSKSFVSSSESFKLKANAIAVFLKAYSIYLR
jgi:hypothetical protein